jgi:serine/threonine protein kinase
MLGANELVNLETNEQLPRASDDIEETCHSGRFEILGDLGGGAYGTVYKARDRNRQGQIVALKKMHITEDPQIGIPPFVMREVANLKRLSEPPGGREPYIVRYVKCGI